MLSSTFSTTPMQAGASFMGADAGAGAMPGTMAFIPRWLLECKELTIAEKLLLAAVMTLPYGLFQHVSDFVMDMVEIPRNFDHIHSCMFSTNFDHFRYFEF